MTIIDLPIPLVAYRQGPGSTLNAPGGVPRLPASHDPIAAASVDEVVDIRGDFIECALS